VLLFRALKAQKSPKAKPAAPAVSASKAFARSPKRKAVFHGCNVLEMGPQARQVWQFDARGGGFVLGRQQTSLDGESLPALVKKDWRSLFQPKLNIAWLPPENVFLRVAQIPRSDFNETFAMVELQLEKLSPIPVAQIVWSFHVLPHATGNLQTVLVMIVARSVVEEFLGKLEGEGYLADRLELPLLDQLQATAITEDGAWIYPDATPGKGTALVAWWYGGVLQSLNLLTLPPTNRPAALKEQLVQMAWAGELEGWLTAPPEWHLVADVGAAEWEPALREGLEQPVEVLVPMAASELAASTARRAAQADPRVNLLPSEFTTRYQQQFHDRLWMRGLVSLGGVYVFGVLIYLAVLAVANYRTGLVEQQVAGLSTQYTNALQLKARYQVLKDRQDLKFAGLDCWNTTANLLPSGATLDRLNFSEGKRLSLSGTAPQDAAKALYDFEAAMRKTMVNNAPLFDPNAGESLVYRQQGQTLVWSLGLILKRSEAE
jgi:Tfp pilus assembly protein PilN